MRALATRTVPNLLLYFGAASYVLYLFHPLVAPLAPLALAKLRNAQRGPIDSRIYINRTDCGGSDLLLRGEAAHAATQREISPRNQAPQPTVTA